MNARRLHALAIGLLLVGLTPMLATARQEDRGSLVAVRRVLELRFPDAPRTEEQVLVELARLGPRAIPVLFDLSVGEGLEDLVELPGGPLWGGPDRVPELARRGLASMGAPRVLGFLADHVDSRTSREVRLVALRLLGEIGLEEGIDFALLWADHLGAASLRYESVSGVFEDTLADILDADRSALRRFPARLEEVDGPLLEIAVRALGRVVHPDAHVALTGMLGRSDELDLLLLERIADLERAFPWMFTPGSAWLVRPLLARDDWKLRRAGAALLARMQDPSAIEDLMELLRDEHPVVRSTAHWALTELTAADLPPAPERWRRWIEEERDWWDAEGDRCLADLLATDPAVAVAAARELASHSFHRHRAAEALGAALPGASRTVALLLCQALAGLDSRRAVPALVDELFVEDEQVRDAAWKSLLEITGESLPPDPWAWRELISG